MILVTTIAVLAVCAIEILTVFYSQRSGETRWATLLYALYRPGLFGFTAILLLGRAFGTPGAVIASCVVVGLYGAAIERAASRTRDLRRHCARLGTNADDATIAAVDGDLERLRRSVADRRGGLEVWAKWVLHAALCAAKANRGVDALRWIESLDPMDLPPSLRARHAQAVASLAIGAGDRQRAREALARIRRPVAMTSIEAAMVATEGLLEALEGDAAAARRRAEWELEKKPGGALRLMWQTARAHALVRLDAPAEARALLVTLQGEHGDDILRRVANHGGPASPLASSLLHGAAPYR